MSRSEELIKEAEHLMGDLNPESTKRFDEIVKELEATDCPEQRQMASDMLHRQMAITEKNLMEIGHELMREQIDDELYKLIPWSYIARTYFHSRHGCTSVSTACLCAASSTRSMKSRSRP